MVSLRVGCSPATGAICLWNPTAVRPILRRVGEQLTQAEIVFVVFGIATQALLLAFFAARRWSPQLAERFGWVVYAFSGLGLPLGVWLLLDGQSWRLFVGPLLMALWALFGAIVDLWRPRAMAPHAGGLERAHPVPGALLLGPDVPVVALVEHRACRLGALPAALRPEHRPQHPRALRRRSERLGRGEGARLSSRGPGPSRDHVTPHGSVSR